MSLSPSFWESLSDSARGAFSYASALGWDDLVPPDLAESIESASSSEPQSVITSEALMMGVLHQHGDGGELAKLLAVADHSADDLVGLVNRERSEEGGPGGVSDSPRQIVTLKQLPLTTSAVDEIALEAQRLAREFKATEGLVRLQDLFGGILFHDSSVAHLVLQAVLSDTAFPMSLVKTTYPEYLAGDEGMSYGDFLRAIVTKRKDDSGAGSEGHSGAETTEDDSRAQSVPNQSDNAVTDLRRDRLGRAAFARYLAARINAISEDSMKHGAYSIHIHGPWGSGKTSVMNFLKEILESRSENGAEEWSVVEFNAWRNQHIGPPWWSLMESVFQTTKRHLNRRDRLSEYFRRLSADRTQAFVAILSIAIAVSLTGVLWRFFDLNLSFQAEDLAKSAAAVASILALVGAIGGIVLAGTRSLLFGSAKAAKGYVERASDPMSELKDRFNELLKRVKPVRVAIFIDDLDRCRGDYVVELLEGIQTLFRESPAVFVVAADRHWLNACYDQQYRDLTEWVHEPAKPLGLLFLEKAFQMTTPLPTIPPDVKKAYWRSLLKADSEDKASRTSDLEAAQKRARESITGAATEAAALRVVSASERATVLDQLAVREAAALRLAEPEVLSRVEHALVPFAAHLEPNPRDMKRLVNAYSVNRTLSLLSFNDLSSDTLARWTILNLRWPRLADFMAKHPDKVSLIHADGVGHAADSDGATAIPEDLRDLFSDREVADVFRGPSGDERLDADAIRRCALL